MYDLVDHDNMVSTVAIALGMLGSDYDDYPERGLRPTMHVLVTESWSETEASTVSPRSGVSLSVRQESPGRLGGLQMTGRIVGGRGLRRDDLRVYPKFAIVYITRGTGSYQGAAGARRAVGPGTAILVQPGVQHWYGPPPGCTWDEIFLVFSGPLYDVLPESGYFEDGRPLRTLLPIPPWAARLTAFRTATPPTTPSACDDEAARLLLLLLDVLAAGLDDRVTDDPHWLRVSRRLLNDDLADHLDLGDVAREAGLSYQTWRKAFVRAQGIPPARYRTERRVAAVAEMLLYGSAPLRDLAEQVGFSDEHHLSRRFREVMGISPREYRRR